MTPRREIILTHLVTLTLTASGSLAGRAQDEELIQQGPPLPSPATGREEKTPRIKYAPATPQEHAAALAAARARGDEVARRMKIAFVVFETDHFIVFTDRDAREQAMLRQALEAAYAAVAQQFDMSPRDNIFVGKLPVFMFDRHDDFLRFARTLDGFETIRAGVQGYYMGRSDGAGHMAMSLPDRGGAESARQAQRAWAYTLTHEFTHAFMARYRTNEFVPRWLNEGIADVIASRSFPDPQRGTLAQRIAREDTDLTFLFDDAEMPAAIHYPVMQSMVEMLVERDRKALIRMIDSIKDGAAPETALREQYGMDYQTLVKLWRAWATQ